MEDVEKQTRKEEEEWRARGRHEKVRSFLAERSGGPSLLEGGVEDVEKQTREEEEEWRAGGRQEKVRSFWQRRHRSLEESQLLDFSSAASVTRRWPTP